MSATAQLSGGLFTPTSHSKSYDFISPLKLNLVHKFVLITGSAWPDGIGYATATAFARAGVSGLALIDMNGVSRELLDKLKTTAAEAGRPEPLVLSCTADISKQSEVEAAHDTVFRAFGGHLDILVNNAAYMEPSRPFLEISSDEYWRVYEVNVRGLFNMARTFLPLLVSSKSSTYGLCTMINVSSSGALSARPNSGSYRSSKLAILRWTESLHLEYGEAGLLTYCVNPGAIKTNITKNAPQKVRDALPHLPDIAGDTITWLAAERREWLSGRYVHCPWDMEEFLETKEDIVENDKLKMRMAF